MGLVILLAQCVAMFVASMLVGSIPLMFRSASGKHLEAISVFGMGILVGAALTIIIPEGVETVYDSIPDGDHADSPHTAIGLSLLAGFALMLMIESLTPHPPHSPPPSPHSTPPTSTTPLRTSSPDSVRSGHSINNSSSRPSPQHLNSHTPIMPKQMHVYDEREDCHKSSDVVRGLNATLGLVIHGAADGIALGASSLTGKGNLGLIVFIAVLVHKGPTALGLTTTLLSLDLDHAAIRKRLLIFSCAAPLGAIMTYLLTSLFSLSSSARSGHADEVDSLSWWTGVVLLFSGGSFLYVATVLQPISAADSEEHSHDPHPSDGHGHGHGQQHQHQHHSHGHTLGKYSRVGWIAAGMGLPVVLTWVVGGGH